jgi:hypothetical protein
MKLGRSDGDPTLGRVHTAGIPENFTSHMTPFFPICRIHGCRGKSTRLGLNSRPGRTSCPQTLSTSSLRLESSPLCLPGCRLSMLCALPGSDRLKRPKRRNKNRNNRKHRLRTSHRLQQSRLRCHRSLRDASRSNRGIFSMRYPPEKNGQFHDPSRPLPMSSGRTRSARKKLSRLVQSRIGGQETATEV